MADADKQGVRTFIVLVDSNSIWTSEEDLTRIDVVPADFQRKWEKLAAGNDVTLMIPQVVVGELAYQKQRHLFRAFRDARTNLSKVQVTLGLDVSQVLDVKPEEIGSLVDQKLRAAAEALPRCTIANTPTVAIGARIGEIIDAAVWRKPPFDVGKSEKGFRDAVILETVRSVQRARPHADIALITRDSRLAEAAKEQLLPDSSNFGLFPDLDSYGSFLELARGRFTPERLHAISKNAEWAFHRAWQELELDGVLSNEYKLGVGEIAFENVKGGAENSLGLGAFGLGTYQIGSRTLDCVGKPVFKFHGTRLLSVVGTDEFHWATMVGIVTPYAERRGILMMRSTKDLEVEPNRHRGMLIQTEWSARANDKDELVGFRLLGKQIAFDNFYPNDALAEAVTFILS